MNSILKLEYFGFFVLGIYVFVTTGFSFWWLIVLFFVPDISMLAYCFGSKIGACIYNLFHSYSVAIAIYFFGYYFNDIYVIMISSILFSHISFDRILGYGLKFSNGFKNTHLGTIGKK